MDSHFLKSVRSSKNKASPTFLFSPELLSLSLSIKVSPPAAPPHHKSFSSVSNETIPRPADGARDRERPPREGRFTADQPSRSAGRMCDVTDE